MGGNVNGVLLEKTGTKLKNPLEAPRITEQPRRHGSCARCVHDPMTQGYWPGGVVEHVAWRQGSRLGAQDRCSLFLIIPYWTHGHDPLHTSCAPWPAGQLGAGRLHYRRVCICVAHDKQRIVAIYFLQYMYIRARFTVIFVGVNDSITVSLSLPVLTSVSR